MRFLARLWWLFTKSPFPQIDILVTHRSFQHINDTFTNDGQKLKPVAGPSCSDEQTLSSGRRAYSKVDILGVAIPAHASGDP